MSSNKSEGNSMSREYFVSHLTGAVVREYLLDNDPIYEVIYQGQVILMDRWKATALLTSIDREECDRLFTDIRYYQKQA
jgi:hypothetical protein